MDRPSEKQTDPKKKRMFPKNVDSFLEILLLFHDMKLWISKFFDGWNILEPSDNQHPPSVFRRPRNHAGSGRANFDGQQRGTSHHSAAGTVTVGVFRGHGSWNQFRNGYISKLGHFAFPLWLSVDLTTITRNPDLYPFYEKTPAISIAKSMKVTMSSKSQTFGGDDHTTWTKAGLTHWGQPAFPRGPSSPTPNIDARAISPSLPLWIGCDNWK